MPDSPQFLPQPEGGKLKKFLAELADKETSMELIDDNDTDSFFFRNLEKQSINLNLSQIAAVRHEEGPALILAGAGSGKTRVLTARTAYLMTVKKVHPKNIMLVTFSKKAADEMKERLVHMPGISPAHAQSVTSGTFHSIFWRLLKSRGYTQNILSSDKQKQLAVKLLLKEMNLLSTYEPETVLSLLSFYKNNALAVSDLPSATRGEKEIKTVLEKYEQWKEKKHYFDFDDMLLESYHLLLSDPDLLRSMQTRFSHVLVDEWQDTNLLQYQLIKMIAAPANNLFVVGDDDQTIYSFNGADQSLIMDFEKRYPSASVYTLTTNYRSNAGILGIANQVIQGNEKRRRKVLKATKSSSILPSYLRPSSTDEEASLVVKQINKLIKEGKRHYRDIAILHRTASSSRAIIDELVRTRIPFVTSAKGDSFYEQGTVKPVIDYLRLSIEPDNLEAVKGITPTLFLNRELVHQHLQMRKKEEDKKQLTSHLLTIPGLKGYQHSQLRDRLSVIASLRDKEPVEAVRLIRRFYDDYLQANEKTTVTMHKDLVTETLSEIETAASQFKTVPDFIQFIDNVITRNREMDKIRNNPYADAISLMTIHRSKGLEFPVVFLIGASEGILPHSSSIQADNRKDVLVSESSATKADLALEEERRLAYVAITRAEENLYISSPSYYRGESTEISRFLAEPFMDQKRKKNAVSDKKVETRIWQCTSPSCICWMRIIKEEDKKIMTRTCPMCEAEMKQKVKKI